MAYFHCRFLCSVFRPIDGSNVAFKKIHFLLNFALISNLTKLYIIVFFCHIAPAAFVMTLYNF